MSDNIPTLRICVVCPDYSGSNGPLASLDDIDRTPAFHCKDANYIFETLKVHKKDVYFMLRKAATKMCPQNHSKRYYDAFFIIADGALDEDRAGVEVLHVLERFNCAFTGARSAFYELTKPEMKVLAKRNGIETAKFAVVDGTDNVRECCKRLQFPLIVKHISGYSSVGMTKKNKVMNFDELAEVTRDFCAEYQSALIEEFVSGLEVTVLACGDSSQPGGCRVYPPVYVTFPEGEDFKHFDLKWISYDGMEWQQLPDEHPAMQEILRVTRVAFQSMMSGVGYGRVDLRIDATTNKVVFLELNPNCGVMYPSGQEASADFILDLSGARESFVKLQIQEALTYRNRTMPLFQVKLDGSREHGWTTRATRAVSSGTTILSLAGGMNNNNNSNNASRNINNKVKKLEENESSSNEQQQEQQQKNQQQQQHSVGVRLVAQHPDQQQQQQTTTTMASTSCSSSETDATSIVTELKIEASTEQQQLRATSVQSFVSDQTTNNNTRISPLTTTATTTTTANAGDDSPCPLSGTSLPANIFPSVTMIPLNISQGKNAYIDTTSTCSGSASSVPSTTAGIVQNHHPLFDNNNSNTSSSSSSPKFGLALNDPLLTCSHIIGGGIPFPKAEAGEVANVVFDRDALCFVATRDIQEHDEILY